MIERWTWHGGAITAARDRFGGAESDWLDLSTGINPRPWPIPPSLSIDWARLPHDEALAGLEEAAAAYFGCDAAYVCAVPGSEIALRLIGGLLDGAGTVVEPSYRTHVEMFDRAECVTLVRAIGGAGTGMAIVLANPNNPDGRIIDRGILLALQDAKSSRWLVVDEAYADTRPEVSLAGDMSSHRKLIVLRSFGKFFGLAGLRLGFVIGPPDFLSRLRSMLGAWPVSAAAVAIGSHAYRDRLWIAETRARLPADAARLDCVLERHGLAPRGACPLFRLVETERADSLFEHLARRHILVRPFAEHPHWLRIGMPRDDAALDRLDRALAGG
ncbi:threonine-phosphate decarboxylase CobD [Rhizorhabdus sp. FW153]|uniref:threonine-phosphate decarboxylase CobD n=1 Tax=Rhizorhabdus sp. FW153 TaxID=3400216 RepID=UPI003CF18BF3